MGHTINGIFLVKPADGNNKNNATARMEVVFCNFSPPSSKADTSNIIATYLLVGNFRQIIMSLFKRIKSQEKQSDH